ncbi:MAG TPA: hypothetical protein VMG63_20665 [Terriglobia bacterium]|nr:hypothetical protein [Terriglobia bacterium]
MNTVVYYSEPALEAVRPDYRYRSPPVHQRAPHTCARITGQGLLIVTTFSLSVDRQLAPSTGALSFVHIPQSPFFVPNLAAA